MRCTYTAANARVSASHLQGGKRQCKGVALTTRLHCRQAFTTTRPCNCVALTWISLFFCRWHLLCQWVGLREWGKCFAVTRGRGRNRIWRERQAQSVSQWRSYALVTASRWLATQKYERILNEQSWGFISVWVFWKETRDDLSGFRCVFRRPLRVTTHPSHDSSQ